MSGAELTAALAAIMPEATAAAAPITGAAAFGSADMLAAGAAGGVPGLLGAGAAMPEALPSLLSNEAPIPYSANMAEMADGSLGMKLEASGMTPNSFTGGYDALNPLQRGLQPIAHGFNQMGTPSNAIRSVFRGGQQPGQTAPVGRTMPRGQPSTQAGSVKPYGDIYEELLKRYGIINN